MEFTVKNLGICNNVAIGNGHDVVKTRGFQRIQINRNWRHKNWGEQWRIDVMEASATGINQNRAKILSFYQFFFFFFDGVMSWLRVTLWLFVT